MSLNRVSEHSHSSRTATSSSPLTRGADESSVEPRLLTRQEIEGLLQQLQPLITGGGQTWLVATSYWNSELRWARNRASMTSDRRNIQIFVSRDIRDGRGTAMTNQIDAASLRGVVQSAERQARENATRRARDLPLTPSNPRARQTTTWSDATYARTVEQSARTVQGVTAKADASGLLSAGYIESRGISMGQLNIDTYDRKQTFYGQMTHAQCSVTVRHPQGTSSGWAALSGYDIKRIDETAIAGRALDKCLTSLNPVRIEPGRYTVILEPQAVADMVDPMVGGESGALFRGDAEDWQFRSALWDRHDLPIGRDRSKLGQRIIDERITISHDPSDPELGILPVPGIGPVTWIKNGVLQSLTYDRNYALNELNDDEGAERRGGYRMSGGDTSVEAMIAGTKRGLLVTRLSGVRTIDQTSLLATGVTRDGLWLIENGRISKAVRNFRFTESPLFALNNVVDIGVPVPVYHPFAFAELSSFFPMFAMSQVIVPALKVNDFSFTSTIDAV